MKKIDLKKSVFELTEENPELIGILKDLGFVALSKPAVRNTMGRVTTLPAGCNRMKIELSAVIRVLTEKGFDVCS